VVKRKSVALLFCHTSYYPVRYITPVVGGCGAGWWCLDVHVVWEYLRAFGSLLFRVSINGGFPPG
jgi:hypothetical protein